MEPSSSTLSRPKSRDVSHKERFFRYFQHEITALQEQMARLADTALIGGERDDATDHCLAGIARLSNEVKDASSYLPTYDQRTYTEAIKALQEKFAETRATFAPRPKFSFKTRKSPSAISLSDAAELAAQQRWQVPGHLSPGASSVEPSMSNTPNDPRTPPDDQSTAVDRQAVLAAPPLTAVDPTKDGGGVKEASVDVGKPELSFAGMAVSISNQSCAHIVLPSSSARTMTPCSLSKIEGCVIDLSGPTSSGSPFAALTMRDIRHSLLLCGNVSGPSHITNVEQSVLVLSCKQFRMHECRNVDVYLLCPSRPIIEDCQGIRFAPLPKAFHHSITQALAESANLWDQVDDFRWLKAQHSPNWIVLPAEDTVSDETWIEVIAPGSPNWALNDILTMTKVRTSA